MTRPRCANASPRCRTRCPSSRRSSSRSGAAPEPHIAPAGAGQANGPTRLHRGMPGCAVWTSRTLPRRAWGRRTTSGAMRPRSCAWRWTGRRSASYGPPIPRPPRIPRPSCGRGRAGRSPLPGSAAPRRWRVFAEVLEPATRAQDDPMNLAYVPVGADPGGGRLRPGDGRGEHLRRESGRPAPERSSPRTRRWPGSSSCSAGRPTAGGCFVAGGTIGNLSALVAARQTALTRRGGRPARRLAAGVHGRTRTRRSGPRPGCSTSRSSRCRRTSAVTSPAPRCARSLAAHAGRLRGGRLGRARRTPALVDDLADIADVCAEHGVWLHVDGAYGGAALAAPSVRRPVRRDRTRRQLHRRPAQVAVRAVRLLRAALPRPRAGAGRARADARATSTTSTGRGQPGRPRRAPVPPGPRPAVLVQPGHPRHRPLRRGDRADPGHRRARWPRRSGPSDHLRLVCEPELSVVLFERPGWDDHDVRAVVDSGWPRRA